MKKIWSLLHHRIVWTIVAALLAIVAVPAIVGLVLKALGLVHGSSLHSWLLDAGQNVDGGGAAGSFGSAAGGFSPHPGKISPEEWNRRHPDDPMDPGYHRAPWLSRTNDPDRTASSGSPATVNGVTIPYDPSADNYPECN